jgi:glycosyltransferase involved in cell wall biosynthesis
MTRASADTAPSGRGAVLLVAPAPPPYGGMALQAQLLAALLRQDGVPVRFLAANLPFPAGLRTVGKVPALRTAVRFALLWRELLRYVRTVDVVHILAASWVYFFVVVYPVVIAARLFRKRIVLNYRGGEADRFFRSYGWAAKPVFAMSDIVTSPSQFLARVIGRHFGISVAIVPNILDTGLFPFVRRTAFRHNLVVARHLEKMYDLESVLRAFRLVQDRYPDATLDIAGTGNQESSLRALADTLGLNNVRFLGFVAHDDLPALYSRCDIFVNASRVDNFPGALLEASAAGLAVVSTCAGGIPFIYEDGKTALLTPPGDWRALGLAVLKVLESPAAAQAITGAAAELVRGFHWSAVRGPLFQAYGFQYEAQPGPAAAVEACRGAEN